MLDAMQPTCCFVGMFDIIGFIPIGLFADSDVIRNVAEV